MAPKLCERPAAKGGRRVRSTRPLCHSGACGASGRRRQRAAALTEAAAASAQAKAGGADSGASGAVSGRRRLSMPLRQRTILAIAIGSDLCSGIAAASAATLKKPSVAAAASAATCAAACAAAAASAAAPKCKSSRARESDKLRQNSPDKQQRHPDKRQRRRLSKSARDAETQTEPCAACTQESRLRVVVGQELVVVQALARMHVNTALEEEVRTCGERLASALHDDGGTLGRGDARGPGGEADPAWTFKLTGAPGPGPIWLPETRLR
jgi:hypothetical protein